MGRARAERHRDEGVNRGMLHLRRERTHARGTWKRYPQDFHLGIESVCVGY